MLSMLRFRGSAYSRLSSPSRVLRHGKILWHRDRNPGHEISEKEIFEIDHRENLTNQ